MSLFGFSNWNGGSGLWTDNASWLYGAPGPGDFAAIHNGSSVLVNDETISGVSLLLDGIRPSNGTLALSMENASTDANTTIGSFGAVTLVLHDSTLAGQTISSFGEMSVSIEAGSTATNTGTMAAASFFSIAPFAASIVIDDNKGTFSNAGALQSATAFSSVTVNFGGQFTAPDGQTIANSGVIQADAGGLVDIEAAHAFTTSFGVLANSGLIDANGGTVVINADLQQAASAVTHIENGGTLDLNGLSTGGTIEITSGMLNFGDFDRGNPGPLASEGLASQLVLDGSSASLGFGSIPISQVFDEASQTLTITAPFSGQAPAAIGSFHLLGPAAFSASDFSVGPDGSTVLFQHPTS